MTQGKAIKEAVDTLSLLEEDFTVPKNVRLKVKEIIESLNDSCEASLKVNKALNILEEIVDDVNVQSYTRTQILNVVSVLESP